jgi:hypothetical protein
MTDTVSSSFLLSATPLAPTVKRVHVGCACISIRTRPSWNTSRACSVLSSTRQWLRKSVSRASIMSGLRSCGG